MIPEATLAFGGSLHSHLRDHLFPGDGLEAAAILVCARTPGPRLRLVVRNVVFVPLGACLRTEASITWPGEFIEHAIDRAESEALTLILIHSHPGGLFAFSDIDDASDRRVIPSLFHAHGDLHGSAVMTPDGAVRARLYAADGRRWPVDLITVGGDELRYWWAVSARLTGPVPTPMAFTSAMTDQLGRLTAVVIGVSGTGSIVAEQAARLGFGRVILVDFDRVERRNLNRILNARLSDAEDRRAKVTMFAEAIEGHRGTGVALPVAASVLTREAVVAASQGDVIFSCVDTLEARQVADLIAAAFLIPLFDVGVVIPVRRHGEGVAIADVCGRVDYIPPGGSTLQDRGVYGPDSLRAEYLRRAAPEAHRQEVDAGYIRGLAEEAPAVITLNMRAASACVNEFIARAFPYRQEPNHLYARTEFSLAACEEDFTAEECFERADNPILARGSLEPILGLPALAPPAKGAPP